MNKYKVRLVCQLNNPNRIKDYYIPVSAANKNAAMDKAVGMVDRRKINILCVDCEKRGA